MWPDCRKSSNEIRRAGRHPVCAVGPVSDPVCEDGLTRPDQALLHGRLKNSEALRSLDKQFTHLPDSHQSQLVQLIWRFPCLFGYTPSCTHVIEHGIDVGDAAPIKQ